MDEFGLIARYLAPLATRKDARALTDDAALIAPPSGKTLVVTKDALCEGVHFTGREPAALIARKALRVNLSDLAAMGATPYGYFLALMAPAPLTERWLRGFSQGLKHDQKQFGVSLLGGDTTASTGPLALSITLLGFAPRGSALTRSGASAGDDIYVTGTVGDGALGLQVAQGALKGREAKALLARYRLPEPRVAVGEKLRLVATSCIDISDGLMQDLEHLCHASQLSAQLRFAHLPLSPPARAVLARNPQAQTAILAGGDDYELLFTAPAAMANKINAIARTTGVPLTCIGHMSAAASAGNIRASVHDDCGAEIALAQKGFRHFCARAPHKK